MTQFFGALSYLKSWLKGLICNLNRVFVLIETGVEICVEHFAKQNSASNNVADSRCQKNIS